MVTLKERTGGALKVAPVGKSGGETVQQLRTNRSLRMKKQPIITTVHKVKAASRKSYYLRGLKHTGGNWCRSEPDIVKYT